MAYILYECFSLLFCTVIHDLKEENISEKVNPDVRFTGTRQVDGMLSLIHISEPTRPY